MLYRVPANVYVADAPIAGGCYEVSAHHDYEAYQSAITKNYHFGDYHRSQTKTTKKVLQRFYERDDSASLMYKFVRCCPLAYLLSWATTNLCVVVVVRLLSCRKIAFFFWQSKHADGPTDRPTACCWCWPAL